MLQHFVDLMVFKYFVIIISHYYYVYLVDILSYIFLQGIDMLIVDSALQYTSSSIACLQLGRRVERACTVYRQEKIGYFKQVRQYLLVVNVFFLY